ncbi:hypothetical protein AB6A40_008426 [Gnathostoma spinigerum]|uniref:2-oxoisovalerate dehydrogenase subunit alpha n=1 Tax=Gnathostoma spinigerum TaxID=75299 RepID=A0ABD6ERE6_9BILA
MYNATKAAREIVLTNKPVLIEAMTYRIGHHSTSDDSSAYRSSEEKKKWETLDNPITRFKLYLQSQSYWTDDEDAEYKKHIRKQVRSAFAKAEKTKLSSISTMFEGVYKQMTTRLNKQRSELQEHLGIYKDKYPTHNFESI